MPQKILLVFLDGVGIGEANAEKNPFFKYGFKTFDTFFKQRPSLENQTLQKGNAVLFPIDAIMGVGGFPQSGTGQTSIFCGINAQQHLDMHFGPYPHSSLLPLIEEHNIFRWYKEHNLQAVFANAYPKAFFTYLKTHTRRLSATTICYQSAGYRLYKSAEVYKGKALTAEITNERWNTKLGYHLPVITPELAAKRLLKIAQLHDFTLYEYFLTDYIGHGRYPLEFMNFYHEIDNFLYTLLTNIPEDVTLIVVSDHGNLEDISVKTHTYNPALGIAAGKHARWIAGEIVQLKDIKNAITRLQLKE
ncbi:MAG: alkaline phosphatase family protein [Ignavibacteriales bacterium]|nr:alkaline phosphatase family protein [Ignavibacteriales bacterium]